MLDVGWWWDSVWNRGFDVGPGSLRVLHKHSHRGILFFSIMLSLDLKSAALYFAVLFVG